MEHGKSVEGVLSELIVDAEPLLKVSPFKGIRDDDSFGVFAEQRQGRERRVFHVRRYNRRPNQLQKELACSPSRRDRVLTMCGVCK